MKVQTLFTMDGPRGTEHGMEKGKRDKDLPSKTDGSKASTKDNSKKTKTKKTDLNKGEQRTDTRLNDNGLDKRIMSKPNDSNTDGTTVMNTDNGSTTTRNKMDLNKSKQRTDTRLNDKALDKRITSQPNDLNTDGTTAMTSDKGNTTTRRKVDLNKDEHRIDKRLHDNGPDKRITSKPKDLNMEYTTATTSDNGNTTLRMKVDLNKDEQRMDKGLHENGLDERITSKPNDLNMEYTTATTSDNGNTTTRMKEDLHKDERRTDERINENGLDKMITSEANDSNMVAKDAGKDIENESDGVKEMRNENAGRKNAESGVESRETRRNEPDQSNEKGKDHNELYNENNTDKESKDKRHEGKRPGLWQRAYSKEMTLVLETEDIEGVNAIKLIKEIENVVGPGKLSALRPRPNKQYEATFESLEDCDLLEDGGLMVNGIRVEVKRLYRSEVMVSFLHLPPYTTDTEVLEKLLKWGVEPILPLRRRYYPGTSVADGTRYIKVRFPKEVASLPYSARFDTPDGPQYCRVIHDRQVKLCRLCLQPGHIMRNCPEFTCRECLQQGHYARECAAPKCPDCRRAFIKCTCISLEEESEGENVEEEQESMAGSEVEGEDERSSSEEDEEFPCAQPHRDPVPGEEQDELCMEESSGIGVLEGICAAGGTGEMGQVEKETQQMEIHGKKDIEKRQRESDGEMDDQDFNRLSQLKQRKVKPQLNIKGVLEDQERRRSARRNELAGRGGGEKQKCWDLK